MTKKWNKLHEKLLGEPLDFGDDDFKNLIDLYKIDNDHYDVNSGFEDLRECIRRIYDINENQLRETSNANEGQLGKLNRRSTAKRQKRYFKKIANQKPDKDYVRVYAEGDSWFQFPTFVKDIIDWLDDNDNYLIYSDAYGGDWITNIMYEGQYVEGLTIHSPDVFLISGGGNDLVGNHRMTVMVTNDSKEPKEESKYGEGKKQLPASVTEEERRAIMLAQPYITKEFHAFIWVMKIQYTLLFKQIYASNSKHKNIISITQGYAYPYPKKGNNFSLRYPLQPIVNSFLNSGRWLFQPFMIRGILDEKTQRAIVMTFIYEFNEVLINLAEDSDFPNVYHIDCRKVPKKQSDWFDELHLKSHKFKEVAEAYTKLINQVVKNNNNKENSLLPKVIRLT